MNDDPRPDTFGLPASLRVPVAARDAEAIATFVGKIVATLAGRSRPVNAVKVQTDHVPASLTDASLWREPLAMEHHARLFPEHQVWVHVDYNGYRSAWNRLGMPDLPGGFVLDHVANRRATRARGLLHPWIRLCPVSGRTNSNAGHSRGAEGLEVAYMRTLLSLPAAERAERMKGFATAIVWADPQDLVKMLDISPGIETLDAVRDTQPLFYFP